MTAARSVDVCIGLGSNLGDREEQLRFAVVELAGTQDVQVLGISQVYETDPVGPAPQDPYLNAAVRIRTSLAARAVLDRCLEIEAAAGRLRDGTRWGPRRLDLDLLLYGDEIIEEPGLQVPHPRLAERAFVLEPLSEIAPEWRHPQLGREVSALAAAVRDPEAVRRVGPLPSEVEGSAGEVR